MNTNYHLDLTEEQYNDVITCIEAANRIACGQIEAINTILPIRTDWDVMDEIKKKSFPELYLNQSYGWSGGHPASSWSRFQASTYALYREMRYKREMYRKSKGYNVYQIPTLRKEGIDLPKIKITET